MDRDDFDDFGWDCDDFDNLGRDRDDFDDRDDFNSGSSSDGIVQLRSLRFADVSGRGDGGVGVDVSMVGIGGAWYWDVFRRLAGCSAGQQGE